MKWYGEKAEVSDMRQKRKSHLRRNKRRKSMSMNCDIRICHRSPIQTETFQPEGKRIMPEMTFTEFPALSVDPRVGISRSASETDVWMIFLTYNIIFLKIIRYLFMTFYVT